MNLYAARRWLYIAETCSPSSSIDKIVFRLDLHSFYTQEIGVVSVLEVHTGEM
jgi:hypothetical protein